MTQTYFFKLYRIFYKVISYSSDLVYNFYIMTFQEYFSLYVLDIL